MLGWRGGAPGLSLLRVAAVASGSITCARGGLPPAQSDDDDEDGEDGEDGEDEDQLDAALASDDDDDDDDEKRTTPSPKQPTTRRVTRSSARARSPTGETPAAKKRRW